MEAVSRCDNNINCTTIFYSKSTFARRMVEFKVNTLKLKSHVYSMRISYTTYAAIEPITNVSNVAVLGREYQHFNFHYFKLHTDNEGMKRNNER